MYYIFPFEKVKKGARVVLWGMGGVGRDYWCQLHQTGYCCVVLVVDKNWAEFKHYPFAVEPPERLMTYPQDAYDAVIIANSSAEAQTAILKTLQSYGVPQEKIVCYTDRRVENDLAEAALLINGFNDLKRLLERSYDEKTHTYNLWQLIRVFEKDISRTLAVVSQHASELTTEDRVITYRALYPSGRMTAEMMRDYVQAILDLPASQRNTKYILGLEFFAMPLMHPSYLYPEFYVHWRQMLRQLYELFDLHLPQKKPEISDHLQRIVIVTSYLYYLGTKNSHQLIVVDTANALAKAGYDVSIVVLDVYAFTPLDYEESLFQRRILYWQESYDYAAVNRAALDDQVKVYYRYEKEIRQRMQGAIDDIYDAKPDLLIDMTDELFVQSYQLVHEFPILYSPIRSFTSGSYFFRYITCNRNLCERYNRIYHGVTSEQILLSRMVDAHVPENAPVYTREACGFRSDDFLIMTSSKRIQDDIDEAIVDGVADFLRRAPRAKWVLIGQAPAFLEDRYSDLIESKRIVPWGWEDNFVSLLWLGDVFYNPVGVGNGVSVRYAMMHGLVVITPRIFSDAANVMGWENMVEGGIPAMMGRIERLYDDPTFFQQEKKRMIAIVEDHKNHGMTFLEICKTCFAEWKAERMS